MNSLAISQYVNMYVNVFAQIIILSHNHTIEKIAARPFIRIAA